MVEWIWLAGAGFFAVGLTGGFFWGQSRTTARRVKELESEVDVVRQEFEQYRGRVVEHFQSTGDLVNNLTESYRAVYRHLAIGAQQLCGEQAQGLTVEREDSFPPLSRPDAHAEIHRSENAKPNGDARVTDPDAPVATQNHVADTPADMHETPTALNGSNAAAAVEEAPASSTPPVEKDMEDKRATVH